MNTSHVVQAAAAVALLVGAAWAMRCGWRRRGQAQRVRFGTLPPVPVPQDRGAKLIGPVSGLYIGSSFAPNWQERVAWGGLGLRARGALTNYSGGFLIDVPLGPVSAADGPATDGLWIPQESVTAVRSERAAAGKVSRSGAFGVIRWTLPNGTLLDSAFRADDPAAQGAWLTSNDQSGRVS